MRGWEYSSVAESLLSMCKALALIPNTATKQNKENYHEKVKTATIWAFTILCYLIQTITFWSYDQFNKLKFKIFSIIFSLVYFYILDFLLVQFNVTSGVSRNKKTILPLVQLDILFT